MTEQVKDAVILVSDALIWKLLAETDILGTPDQNWTHKLFKIIINFVKVVHIVNYWIEFFSLLINTIN